MTVFPIIIMRSPPVIWADFRFLIAFYHFHGMFALRGLNNTENGTA